MIRGTVSSKKGFYLGDPYFALNDSIYYDFWGRQKNFSDGVFKFKDLYFAVGAARQGVGCYKDNLGNEYPVNSGTIALIPLELVSKKVENVFNIPGDAKFSYQFGVFDIMLPDGRKIHIDDQETDAALDKHIWEGWRVRDFIEALKPRFELLSCGEMFKTREALAKWCADNQPYYKSEVPEVVDFFVALCGNQGA